MKLFWTRTYRKNIEKMIGVCYRYVLDRPTAEDLAHDAFLTAIEKADSYRSFGSFEGWLMRIAANKALLYLREQDRIRPLKDDATALEAEIPDDEEPSPDDMMAAIRKADFSQEEIMDAIARLPNYHRTVLNLYVFERLTHQQIADLLNISPNTSKSHLLRARKELQKILFNKSKEKKHLLMILLPLFIHPDTAIDGYCRSQLKNFAIPPLKPLKEDVFPTTSKVSPELWMYAHWVPITAGIAAASAAVATTCILLAPAPQSNPTLMPQIAESHPVIATTDSIAENDEPASYEAGNADKAIMRPSSVSSSPSTPEETVSADNPTGMPENQQPVVVKKIRRTKRTIVIQDSTKQ